MEESIDIKLDETQKKLVHQYGTENFIRLEDIIGVEVSRFSNVTLGNDEVKYQLINTRDVASDGSISVVDKKESLKTRGTQKVIEKYTIKKGDIIFPLKRSFKSIGVMTSNPDIPYVGHHGLIRISCGEDNLDLAFFLKDYLMYSPVMDIVSLKSDAGNKLMDIIKIIPVPCIEGSIVSYKDTVVNLKLSTLKARDLQNSLTLLTEKYHASAVNSRNTSIDNKMDSILAKILKIQEEVELLLK